VQRQDLAVLTDHRFQEGVAADKEPPARDHLLHTQHIPQPHQNNPLPRLRPQKKLLNQTVLPHQQNIHTNASGEHRQRLKHDDVQHPLRITKNIHHKYNLQKHHNTPINTKLHHQNTQPQHKHIPQLQKHQQAIHHNNNHKHETTNPLPHQKHHPTNQKQLQLQATQQPTKHHKPRTQPNQAKKPTLPHKQNQKNTTQ